MSKKRDIAQKKLKLDELKVQSFVTALNSTEGEKIKGRDQTNGCQTDEPDIVNCGKDPHDNGDTNHNPIPSLDIEY